jgi:hypothetical protein
MSRRETTKVIVEYDAGYTNSLFVRGEGIPNLSWQKGIKLKNIKENEWEWEIEESFRKGEFKVLINDMTYEMGENHPLHCGATIRIHPKFP